MAVVSALCKIIRRLNLGIIPEYIENTKQSSYSRSWRIRAIASDHRDVACFPSRDHHPRIIPRSAVIPILDFPPAAVVTISCIAGQGVDECDTVVNHVGMVLDLGLIARRTAVRIMAKAVVGIMVSNGDIMGIGPLEAHVV